LAICSETICSNEFLCLFIYLLRQPTGIRTFFYGNTILLDKDGMWCKESERTHLNLTIFSNNSVHTPSGGNSSAPSGDVCVPPGANRPPCGRPPYLPTDGCTAALGCCHDASKPGAKNGIFFECFPYVFPEPVLAE
jgi:hypothetical protein